MAGLSDFTSRKILERYRIAQTFHELRASGVEALVAATQVSIRLGVNARDVFASAAEFKREPLWRL
jgi:hypothetical protein